VQVTIRLETDEGPKSGFQKAYRIGVVFFYITATRSFHFFFIPHGQFYPTVSSVFFFSIRFLFLYHGEQGAVSFG